MGHDRFLADLRPLLRPILEQRGWAPGLCCHPYDLCTELVAREAGIEITDEFGHVPNAPLNLASDVCWIGYANRQIRTTVEPLPFHAVKSYPMGSSEAYPSDADHQRYLRDYDTRVVKRSSSQR